MNAPSPSIRFVHQLCLRLRALLWRIGWVVATHLPTLAHTHHSAFTVTCLFAALLVVDYAQDATQLLVDRGGCLSVLGWAARVGLIAIEAGVTAALADGTLANGDVLIRTVATAFKRLRNWFDPSRRA